MDSAADTLLSPDVGVGLGPDNPYCKNLYVMNH